MRVVTKMQGMEEVKARLRSLGIAIGQKAIVGAMAQTAKVVRADEARASPGPDPEDKDNQVHIRQEWVAGKSRRRSGKHRVVYAVGVRYFKDVAFLKKVNRINKNAKVKAPKKGMEKEPRGAFYWKFREFGSRHQKADPYVARVFEGKAAAYTNIFATNMAEAVRKWERKLSSRGRR